MEDNLHKNDNYLVRTSQEGDCYEVINRTTGIMEFTNIALPTCISVAEEMNAYLVNQLWTWIGSNAKERAESSFAGVAGSNATH